MGSPQAVIRPLVVNKRRSLDAIQECPEPRILCTIPLPETWSKTERPRSRRFSLPIEVIPEINEPRDPKSESPPGSDQSRENVLLSRLEKHKGHLFFSPCDIGSHDQSHRLTDNLLHKAKELEREAYQALFEAEYLRWQAENNCQNFSLDSSIPAALSLKAEELGLQSRNFSLNSTSTTSLPIQSRSSTNLVEKRISSLSGRTQCSAASLNTKFLGSTGSSLLSPSTSAFPPLYYPCPTSPFISSSHHDLEYEDSELRPFIQTGRRTLKKPRSRMMGPSRDNTTLRQSLLPKKKWFRFKCPFLFLICCSRRKKYGSCRQSVEVR